MMREITSYIDEETLKRLGENDCQGLDTSAVMAQENCHKKGMPIIQILRESK